MQEVFVALIVAWAAYAVISRYLPRSVKRRMHEAFVRFAARLGWTLPMPPQEKGSSTAGCGSCSGCGSKPEPSTAQTISLAALRRTARR